MKRVLVFGASGQIGDGLLPMLRDASCDVVAVSRQQHADSGGLRWIAGALDASLQPPAGPFDAAFSLGPLDVFAQWHERAGPIAPRVVAFGSTSLATKSGSADAAERDIAQRLRAAEESLFASGSRHGIAVTVLRPTMIYGRGRDRILTRIAAFARRRGFFALPRNATGLRQPVHADDLAAAAFAVACSTDAGGRAYDLPGGETLRFDAMVARTLAALSPSPSLLRLSTPLFRLALKGVRGIGLVDAVNDAMLDRLDVDLVFDAGDARRDLGYAPRAFAPDAAMFTPPP